LHTSSAWTRRSGAARKAGLGLLPVVAVAGAALHPGSACAGAQEDQAREQASLLLQQLLGASAGLADGFDELDRLLKLPKEELVAQDLNSILGGIALRDYLSEEPLAVSARRKLLLLPLASYRDALAADLRTCDLATRGGTERALFGMRLLEEKTLGSFGWDWETEPPAKGYNPEVLASWFELLSNWWQGEAGVPRLYDRTSKAGLVFKQIKPAMSPGDRLQVRLDDGLEVEVRALLGFERAIAWRACERTLVLDPSYDVGSAGLPLMEGGLGYQDECSGIRRFVISERCLPELDEQQAAAWKAGGPGVQVAGPQRLLVRRDGYSLALTIERALEQK
jgi:hypothetical protein